MMKSKHIPEEQLVDYLLGNIGEWDAKQIKAHLNHCKKCQNLLSDWQFLLRQDHKQFQPSQSMKDRIQHSIIQVEEKSFKRRTVIGKPGLLFATIACVFLIFYSVHSYYQDINTRNYEIAENDEIPPETIQSAPHTQQIKVTPVSEFNQINGYVWVNRNRNEMLLEVDGLEELINQDYQLWIIYMDNSIDHEILPTQNGMTRMLFRDIDVDEFKKLKASVEPRGGSIEQTGPDTFIVEFQ
ncbi:anti-sigma factor [Caldifermentibacillus hisashii]|uniref:anti-sigma factor n=1 Tax=Bacillaceae TaxID=186817 RepID=UPI0020414D9F|nr:MULTISPECIES: anti-sigma factor [Bacillaceae]MCM3799025.1 anti-sigma factor [Caldibacillus thermoamylovorans]MED3644103.1 anti-sigma factor [Caldifermentibacillus hisashii]